MAHRIARPRRPLAWLLAAAALTLAALPARLTAQTPDQPNLIFTISGGISTGPSLWTLPRQLAVVHTLFGAEWDSVTLGRSLVTGFTATLGATYFRSPHLGYSFEVGFFGLDSQSSCRGLGPWVADSSHVNQYACQYLQGDINRGDAVGFLGGLMWRFTRGGTQPFVRAAIGPAILGSSYVEEEAPVILSNGGVEPVYFLADQNHRELSWMASLGAGVMLPLAPGYQLHVEVRDLLVSLPRPTGPATDTSLIAHDNVLPQPPTGMRLVQVPSITIGLDVVLEKKPGHRY